MTRGGGAAGIAEVPFECPSALVLGTHLLAAHHLLELPLDPRHCHVRHDVSSVSRTLLSALSLFPVHRSPFSAAPLHHALLAVFCSAPVFIVAPPCNFGFCECCALRKLRLAVGLQGCSFRSLFELSKQRARPAHGK